MSVTVSRRCPMCGKVSFVDINTWCEYEAYEAGLLAQEAFPQMDLRDRETIISGMCKPCQTRFFEMEDEEDCDGECSTCEHYDCPLITNKDS